MSLEGLKENEGSKIFSSAVFASFARQILFSNSEMCDDWQRMGEPNKNPRRYKWPWFVLAAVLLFLALAVLWVGYAAHREKQERDFNTAIPTGSPGY
jgi:hypothetical protein